MSNPGFGARPKATDIAQMFWAILHPTLEDNRCWEWPKSRERGKYGRFHATIDGRSEKKAHRVAWLLTYGVIPSPWFVCHHCDNPACCRPSHLFLGTSRDNTLDMVRKGRLPYGQRKHDTHGRWCRITDTCLHCHQATRPHQGHGLCRACYQLVSHRPHSPAHKARTALKARLRRQRPNLP